MRKKDKESKEKERIISRQISATIDGSSENKIFTGRPSNLSIACLYVFTSSAGAYFTLSVHSSFTTRLTTTFAGKNFVRVITCYDRAWRCMCMLFSFHHDLKKGYSLLPAFEFVIKLIGFACNQFLFLSLFEVFVVKWWP